MVNEKEMIEFWKRNEKPFGLCTAEAQEWLKVRQDHVECFQSTGNWLHIINPSFKKSTTYRLEQDYQPKPAGRWVECEVRASIDDHPYYIFQHPDRGLCVLHEAPGVVGFGGVEYEGWGWEDVLGAITKDGTLCRPIRVKFWVEE